MKPVQPHSPLPEFAFFIALLFVALVAVVLVQNGAGPLVAGGSVRSLVSTASSSSVSPSSPAGISRVPSPTLPLVGSGDWVVTLPYYSLVSASNLFFGNNGQHVVLLHRTSMSPPIESLSLYQTSNGTLLQTHAFPASASVYLDAARDADAVGVSQRIAPNCPTVMPTLLALKFTSQQSNPVFSTDLGSNTCGAHYSPHVSPLGGIHAANLSTEYKWFAPANTSGVPDAVLSLPSLGASNLSMDGHYLHRIVSTQLSSSHGVYHFWTTPGTIVYSSPSQTAPVANYTHTSDYDGSHFFFCEQSPNGTSTRLMLLTTNPAPSGTNDSYQRIPIDAWTGTKNCTFIQASDDGKTVYLFFRDTMPSSSYALNTYSSSDGIGYSLVAHAPIHLPFYTRSRATRDGSRLMVFYGNPGHGAASQVQIFDREKNTPAFLMDVPNEQITAADLSPDGEKVTFTTCSPSASSCTTSRLRVYDLSLIPTGVRAEYVSNPANRVRVRWDGVSGALSYSVFRGLSEDTASAQIVASGITGTEWIDDQVVAGQTYHYWVKARDTLTHFFSSGAKVLIGNAVPALDPCPVEGAVLNANGTCTLTVPVSVTGYGTIDVQNATSWSAVQNASSGNNTPYATFNGVVGSASYGSGPFYLGIRSFFHANIPMLSGVTLQSVVLKTIVLSSTQTVFDSASTFNVVRSTQTVPNVLSGSDYSHALLAPSDVFASLPQSSLTPGAPAAIPFTATGKTALLAASGKPFTFALVEGHHLLGNTFPIPTSSYTENTIVFTGSLSDSSPPMVFEIVFTP